MTAHSSTFDTPVCGLDRRRSWLGWPGRDSRSERILFSHRAAVRDRSRALRLAQQYPRRGRGREVTAQHRSVLNLRDPVSAASRSRYGTIGSTHRRSETGLPDWIKPQLTQLVDEAPDGPEWLHEVKFDGYRMHARLDRGAVRLLTRTGLDWTRSPQPSHRLPPGRPISTASSAACVPTAPPPSA
jgi:hypothetical protein